MVEADSRLVKAAKVAIKDCLGVTTDEHVAIITDDDRLPIAKAMAEAVIEQQAFPIIFFFTSKQKDYYQSEVPMGLSHALKRVDVVIALYEKVIRKKLFFAKLFKWLRENIPCRIAALPGITKETFCESMGGDFSTMAELAEQLVLIFLDSSKIHVSTENGTDLLLSFSSKRFSPETSTGIIKQLYSIDNIPGAEAYAIPLPESITGTATIDGSMPGRIVEKPFSMRIRDGKVVKIEPRSNTFGKELKKSFKRFGNHSRIVGEFGIGLNEAIRRLYGITLIDEKMLGTAHIGLGDNSAFGGPNTCGVHIDLVMMRPTIEVDGKKIMDRGNLKFKLSDFQKSFKDIPFKDIDTTCLVTKETNRICIARNDTFQIFWKGGGGGIHFSTTFDQETAELAVKVWEKLGAIGRNIQQIGRETGIDHNTLARIILLLKSEGLVSTSYA